MCTHASTLLFYSRLVSQSVSHSVSQAFVCFLFLYLFFSNLCYLCIHLSINSPLFTCECCKVALDRISDIYNQRYRWIDLIKPGPFVPFVSCIGY